MNEHRNRQGVWMLLFFAVALSSITAASAAPPSLEAAKADILGTYDFEPSIMTFDQQASHAPGLSELWDRFDGSPEVYRQALRTLLGAEGGREIMYCDGGMLLLEKATDPDDRKLGLKSIGKCALAEIEHTPYFYTLHRLAVSGTDTLDLQFRILEKPKYSVFIVAHALSLGQDYAFLYPLLVQEEANYVPRLVERLRSERDATAQKSLIRALWYSATPEAESALRALAANPGASDAVRDDARNMLKRVSETRGWNSSNPSLKKLLGYLKLKSEPAEAELRAKRRERMRSISDEALYDLEAYTILIYRARKTVQ